jgi:ribonuclease HI
MLRNGALNIYADGSAYSHPRAGGIGVRIIFVDSDGLEEIEDPCLIGYSGATNNQMELLACTTGLQLAAKHPRLVDVQRVCIFTDSRYVSDNWKNALYSWPDVGWYTRAGTPVLNAKQWKEFTRWIRKIPRRVEVSWVKGHSQDPHNRAVDRLAKASAKSPFLNKPLAFVSVRRKTTSQTVQRGCVGMLGQRLVIRVISSEYLPVQRTNKYKYEVLSRRSRYVGLVDILFSNIDLRSGHHYLVSLNKAQTTPSIVSLHCEVERPKPKEEGPLSRDETS